MTRFKVCLAALAVTALGISTTANAQTILDNTLNGTRGFAGTGSGISVGSGFRRAFVFTVGGGDTLNLSSVKVAMEGAGSFSAALYSWAGTTPTGGALASQVLSVTSPVDNNDHYYDFNLTGSGWTGVGAGTYAFIFDNQTGTLLMDRAPAGTIVTNGVTGLSSHYYSAFLGNWFSAHTYDVLFQLNGTVTSGTSGGGGAVPEPGEWAAMGILGAGLAGLVIRKRRQA